MRQVKSDLLGWKNGIAQTPQFNFVVYLSRGTWHWRVRNGGAIIGEGLIHDSIGANPRGYASSAAAKDAAQQWLDRQRLAGRAS